MKQENKLLTYFMIILGNTLVAISVSFLILPNNTLSGGVAGVAVALKPIIPIDSVIIIDVLTLFLFFIGYIFLGKKFALRTLLSTIVYPVAVSITSYIASLFPEDTFIVEPYLAAIYSGILSGIGLAICFRVNASTGGMDIPSLLIHKYTGISNGSSVAIVDICTILLGLATYGLQPALIGILSVFTCSAAINRTVVLGYKTAKNVMIVSDSWMEINDYITNQMSGTSTILEGKGGYNKDRKPVLMTVIEQKSYPKLEAIVKEIDPYAFVIVSDVNEVIGEGYTYEGD